MDKGKLTGIIMCSMGIIMFIATFGLFSIYSIPKVPMVSKITYNLFFSKISSFPAIVAPISVIIIPAIGLFSILLGISSFPAIVAPISATIIFISSLFFVIFGFNFFILPFQFELTLDYFTNINFTIFLVLISGLLYFVNSFFLLQLKNWARKLVIIYSAILIFYFIPISIHLFSDPWGWGGALAFSLLPYMIFPLFLIIFLTRPKVKEQFKK